MKVSEIPGFPGAQETTDSVWNDCSFFFKNMGNENIWRSVMWDGWYRVYVVPDRKVVDKLGA